MEKRKAKIIQQLNNITEEKNTVVENLDVLLFQVSSCSDFVQSTKDMSKYLEIITYELDIMKKLSEINFELEKLAELCPIGFQELQVVEENPELDTPVTNNIDSVNGVEEVHSIVLEVVEEMRVPEVVEEVQNIVPEVAEEVRSIIPEVVEEVPSIAPDLSEPNPGTHILYNNTSDFELPVRDVDEVLECTNTALKKLDNYAANKKKLVELSTVPSLISPDIKLMPASLETGELTEPNKKKKNKKRKKDLNNIVFIELRPKAFPNIGDQCYFSHVESPSEFYIQVVDEETAIIDKMGAELDRYFSDSVCAYDQKEKAFELIKNFGCVYIQTYNRWFRCRILDWFLEKKTDSIIVHLIDYGDKQITSYKNLRRIPKEFAEVPMLAIQCFFPLLYPPGSTHLNRKTSWPQESIDALGNLSLLFDGSKGHEPFTIEYACGNVEEQKLAIDLLSTNDTEKTLGQILLDLRFAEQLVDSIDEDNLELEEFTRDVDILENALNINEAVLGYDPKDESRICRFSRKDGTCFKGKNCKLEHTKLTKDGITTDQEPVFTDGMFSLVLPVICEIVTILVSGHLNICNFYIQLVRTPHFDNVKNYIMDFSMYNLLTEMNSDKIIKLYEPFRIRPSIGEAVIVHNYWSNEWLRAIVISSVDDNTDEISVFTVDFGECIKVKISDLRKAKQNFWKLPYQAVRCYMGGYRACARPDADNFFYENMYCRNFIAEVLSSEEPLKIKLQTQTAQDVGKRLLEAGYVEKCLADTFIQENSRISAY